MLTDTPKAKTTASTTTDAQPVALEYCSCGKAVPRASMRRHDAHAHCGSPLLCVSCWESLERSSRRYFATYGTGNE